MNDVSGSAVKRSLILIIATATGFTTPFLSAAINIAIPTIRREFSMEAVMMTWVGTIFFLSIAVVQVPCGRLADIYGRKKLFIIGLLVTIFAALMGTFSVSTPMLLASLAFIGVGSGIMFNNSISILTSVFPNEMRLLLERHGFRVMEVYGSYDMEPLTRRSERMIFVSAKA